MDPTGFLSQVLSGLVPQTTAQAAVLLTPMVLIFAAIQAVKAFMAKMIVGYSQIVEGSPLDKTRWLVLFFSPYVCGVVYMIGARVFGARYTVGQIVLGGLALGLVNHGLYVAWKWWRERPERAQARAQAQADDKAAGGGGAGGAPGR